MNKLVTTEEYEFLINVCIFEVLFDSCKAEKIISLPCNEKMR